MSKLGHRYEDALAYAQDFLEPAEKADFEAHLATCAECQESLAFARKFLPALNEALLAKSPLTDAQLLANVRAEHQRRYAEPSWLVLHWGKLILGIVGGAIATMLLIVVADLVLENRHGGLAAPIDEHNYHPDGGAAGK